MNWKGQVDKLISDGKTTHTCFYWEKRMEDDEGKENKSTTPSLTFPFPINLNKADNLAEKADMRQGGSGIKQIC